MGLYYRDYTPSTISLPNKHNLCSPAKIWTKSTKFHSNAQLHLIRKMHKKNTSLYLEPKKNTDILV